MTSKFYTVHRQKLVSSAEEDLSDGMLEESIEAIVADVRERFHDDVSELSEDLEKQAEQAHREGVITLQERRERAGLNHTEGTPEERIKFFPSSWKMTRTN